MIKTIKHIIRGCGYLPNGYEEHPGTVVLFAFILMGAIAGSHGGWKGTAFGASAMSIMVAPFYLMGAYDRSVEEERYNKKFNI